MDRGPYPLKLFIDMVGLSDLILEMLPQRMVNKLVVVVSLSLTTCVLGAS